MNFIENAQWRYATKQFDPAKKVSRDNINLLKEAIRLAPTSFGLQAFKVLIITNSEIKKELVPVSWNQNQVADASHLFVFCNYTKGYSTLIEKYIQLNANVKNIDIANLEGLKKVITDFITTMPQEVIDFWAQKQIYIAMNNLLSACAELKIDSCPMEGFIVEEYNKILGLEAQNLNTAIVVPVGYRSENDAHQHAPKVRKSSEDLFEDIN